MSKVAQCKLPPVFWDAGGSGYWIGLNGEFQCMEKSEAGEHLIDAGLDDPDEKIGGLTKLKRAFMVARKERAVSYAGPLAGWRRGLHTLSSGAQILVTSESRLFVQKLDERKLPPRRLAKFFTELLGEEQCVYFMAWLKFAHAALLAGDFRPGQVPVFAGESGSGKSLCQDLITESLGGRSALPYRYMTGKTCFNQDLAEAEHHVIADQHASTAIMARRAFGTAIKESVANTLMSIHAKGRKAIALPTFRRTSVSVNSEPENLMIVPPLDDSIRDKIMLFKCSAAELSESREKNWEMAQDLPALAGYLKGWKVPSELKDKRYGVIAYHNPELAEILEDVQPEMRLLEIIDAVCFAKDNVPLWRGSATQLEQELRGNGQWGGTVANLIQGWGACGTYLSRLVVKRPQRFQSHKVQGKTIWIIRAPIH